MLKNYNIKLLRMFILSLLIVSPYYIRILRRYIPTVSYFFGHQA